MKKNYAIGALICLISVVFLSACSKNDNPSSKTVKYEVTGNFTGKLLIVYSDNINGNTTVTDATLPWSKEVTYGTNVLAIGISGNASTVGVAGQTATLKIHVNGQVVKSQTATAGSLGELALPSLSYTF
ncbi:MAG: MmpS family transport accessory protein [Niabella sp.]